MKMNLKNYTSTVTPARSVSQIEQVLVSIGATHISKTYDNGALNGITFQVIQDSFPMTFKLPANVAIIQEMMLDGIKKPHRGTRERIIDQAQRTAWKLLLDLVEVKASMILIGRRNVVEQFFPYVYDIKNDQTLFERFQKNNFKMLKSGE